MSLSSLSSSPLHDNVIFFDWDDTLFPTTSIFFHLYQPSAAEFQHLTESLIFLLTQSQKVAQVFIVTNSETGWVHQSAHNYIPEIIPILNTLTVISAHDLHQMAVPKPSNEKLLNRWYVDAKKMAMKLALEQFLLGKNPQHFISVGDSLAEKIATDELGPQTGLAYHAIKLSNHPDWHTLLAQHVFLEEIITKLIFSGKYDLLKEIRLSS